MNITLKNEISKILRNVPADHRRDVSEAIVGFVLSAHMSIPATELDSPRNYFNDLYLEPTKAALSDLVETFSLDIESALTHARTLWLYSYDMVWDRTSTPLLFLLTSKNKHGIGKLAETMGLLQSLNLEQVSDIHCLDGLIAATAKYYGKESGNEHAL